MKSMMMDFAIRTRVGFLVYTLRVQAMHASEVHSIITVIVEQLVCSRQLAYVASVHVVVMDISGLLTHPQSLSVIAMSGGRGIFVKLKNVPRHSTCD
jgi:hypothetical protein